ncbi:MAG: DUF1801 domain-containing protein [Fluviicola sp.]|nr:DUF1801 domain-containing protein [Fluviicola sp.]MBP6271681.1 DUF1801 domain-containing protein [Fluviicola sp.]
MKNEGNTPAEIVANCPEDRKDVMGKMRQTILESLPKGFEEGVGYGMILYFVPHTIYPAGYHCDPKQPLPFVSLASQKNFIALYHMGLYADPALLSWFIEKYKATVSSKLDMGKSCIRFKKMTDIPFELIGELMTKISVESWIETYEKLYKKK